MLPWKVSVGANYHEHTTLIRKDHISEFENMYKVAESLSLSMAIQMHGLWTYSINVPLVNNHFYRV